MFPYANDVLARGWRIVICAMDRRSNGTFHWRLGASKDRRQCPILINSNSFKSIRMNNAFPAEFIQMLIDSNQFHRMSSFTDLFQSNSINYRMLTNSNQIG